MHKTGAMVAAETLLELGATHVFGNPGTTELPFVDAIVETDLRYVTCLHEDVAMGAAAGFATRSMQLARENGNLVPLTVANVHTTPGVAHALGNLYGTQFSRAPVMLTAGCQEPRHERRHPPLSGDRIAMVDPHVKQASSVTVPAELPETLARGARIALTRPMGPTYLEFPLSVQNTDLDVKIPQLGSLQQPDDPDEAAVTAAAEQVRDASVTIVVGSVVPRYGSKAIDSITALAEHLHAPVYAEPLYAELGFPTDHPNWVGMLPLTADGIRDRLNSETIVFIGCTHPEPFLDYEPPIWNERAEAIWIGPNLEEVRSPSSFSTVVVGDIGEAVTALVDAIGRRLAADGDGITDIRREHRAKSSPRLPDEDPVEVEAKRLLVEAISKTSTEAVIVDEGVTTGFILRDIGELTVDRFIGHNSGGLGYGLPAAVGAALAESTHADPPRPIVALIGDGSYQYYPQTLYTAAQYVGGSLTVVVPHNDGYGILRDQGMIDEASSPDRPLTFDPSVSVTDNAASYGVRTRSIESPEVVEGPLTDAIQTPGTDVLSVRLR